MSYGQIDTLHKQNKSKNTRVFLADHNGQVRSALQLLLNQQPDIEIVGEARQAVGLLHEIQEAQPDLILLEWELPGHEKMDLPTALQALAFKPTVVILSCHPEERSPALQSGADAFVDKGQSPDELMTTLYHTMRGA